MKKQQTAPAENQDFLADALAKTIAFYKKHQPRVLAALAVIILVAMGITLYSNHCKAVSENSWAAYYNAQMALISEGPDAGFVQLDKVAADFKNTPAAGYAMLLKGNILYSQDNFAQAANVYKELLNSSNKMLATEAALSYAAALQGAQDYPASIEVMKNFIAKNSKSFALPQAYLTLAMSQELAGQKDEALENYKYLLENHTKTYFGTLAKDKITQLQK